MKPTVAVFFGGRSAEHDVSIITAYIPVIQSLQAMGTCDVVPVYIAKSGLWYSVPGMQSLEFFQDPGYEERLAAAKPLQTQIGGGLTLIWPGGLRPRSARIDVAFPAMHGTYGEDGTLMGLLRLADIPFVGCDLEASAIAMDKVLTKLATEPLGIPSTPYIWFTTADWAANSRRLLAHAAKLKFPLFVKPVHLGSTIAITKVDQAAELENAIEVALHYDDKVIVEQGVANLIEVTLPIMGNDDPTPALIERPLATFFDFEEKYLKGGGKKGKGGTGLADSYSELPAKLSPELTERVLELGLATYKAIGASYRSGGLPHRW
jgi:D-alanine-D-alanine ligase